MRILDIVALIVTLFGLLLIAVFLFWIGLQYTTGFSANASVGLRVVLVAWLFAATWLVARFIKRKSSNA